MSAARPGGDGKVQRFLSSPAPQGCRPISANSTLLMATGGPAPSTSPHAGICLASAPVASTTPQTTFPSPPLERVMSPSTNQRAVLMAERMTSPSATTRTTIAERRYPASSSYDVAAAPQHARSSISGVHTPLASKRSPQATSRWVHVATPHGMQLHSGQRPLSTGMHLTPGHPYVNPGQLPLPFAQMQLSSSNHQAHQGRTLVTTSYGFLAYPIQVRSPETPQADARAPLEDDIVSTFTGNGCFASVELEEDAHLISQRMSQEVVPSSRSQRGSSPPEGRRDIRSGSPNQNSRPSWIRSKKIFPSGHSESDIDHDTSGSPLRRDILVESGSSSKPNGNSPRISGHRRSNSMGARPGDSPKERPELNSPKPPWNRCTKVVNLDASGLSDSGLDCKEASFCSFSNGAAITLPVGPAKVGSDGQPARQSTGPASPMVTRPSSASRRHDSPLTQSGRGTPRSTLYPQVGASQSESESSKTLTTRAFREDLTASVGSDSLRKNRSPSSLTSTTGSKSGVGAEETQAQRPASKESIETAAFLSQLLEQWVSKRHSTEPLCKEERRIIHRIFFDTMNSDKAKIIRVDRVIQPELLNNFCREELESLARERENQKKHKELMLLHGTRWENVPLICAMGLDPDCGHLSKGSWLGQNAESAHSYASKGPGPQQQDAHRLFAMFVVACLPSCIDGDEERSFGVWRIMAHKRMCPAYLVIYSAPLDMRKSRLRGRSLSPGGTA
eukprot:TRINITY_DN7224_c0_g1_i2.p1 TRINITY_DN7224_c0_g1~~TRINITY_DN7224_c0_g1_i2.p1  ORF type:complete len:732 (+),score=70.29 TRINITY_DN7224_c0_g1_i2:186-2381(+)